MNNISDKTEKVKPEHYPGSVTGLNSHLMPSGNDTELERTLGEVAVSGDIPKESAGGGVESPPGLWDREDNRLKQTCANTAWAVVAECQTEKGKFFGKRIYCNKEWCPVCGQKRSRSHNRKIARVLPKAQQIKAMGYFVIEFPDRYRKVVSWAYSRKALDIASKKIVEVMAGKRSSGGRKGGFFTRGLLRWHWFGDIMKGKWNPHANVLVDGAFLDNLEPIKAALRSALHCPDLIIHYSFKELPAEKFQKVEYITRATFLDYDWNPFMAAQLFGFRNQRWWGSWKDAPVWSADPDQECEFLAIEALENKQCPDCGGDLVWTKPVHASWLNTWGAVEIGETGYYRIPAQAFSGDTLSPSDITRLDKVKYLCVAHTLAIVRAKEGPWPDIMSEADSYGVAQD